jgi:hypothetical protein
LDEADEESFYRELEQEAYAASAEIVSPKNIVISFAGNEVSLVDILEAVIQGSQEGKFRDTAFELQQQMKDILKGKSILEPVPCDHTTIIVENEDALPTWPDSVGVWGYKIGHKLYNFRYLAEGKVDSDGYLTLVVRESGADIVRFGSLAKGTAFSDDPNIRWVKIADLDVPAVAEAVNVDAIDAAFSDEEFAEVQAATPVDGTDTTKTITPWPNKPGVWGYIPSSYPADEQGTTDERYEVTDRATHGGEYLVRKFGSGEFFRRPGSQLTLAVSEFGDEVRGWKLLEA